MCIRRYVLYRCGHEGRQLGYSYCRFQEALDRLSDKQISDNHPIIQQHQNSCRKTSGRRGERRNRDCGQCSRAPRPGTQSSRARARGSANEEVAAEADDENVSYPFHEDEDSEGEISRPLRPWRLTQIVELDVELPYPAPENKGSDGETGYLSLSGNEASEEGTDGTSGNEGSGEETDNFSLSESGEQRAKTPSSDDFFQTRTTTNNEILPEYLPPTNPGILGLAHKASGSHCSTCSEAAANDMSWSTGSELWNEDYQGERATAAVLERPRGEGCRVVDVAASAAAGLRGNNRLEEKERKKESADEDIMSLEGAEEEMEEMSLDTKKERDDLEESEEMPVAAPRLRRKRKNLALRGST